VEEEIKVNPEEYFIGEKVFWWYLMCGSVTAYAVECISG
jgi:hypothetical protein